MNEVGPIASSKSPYLVFNNALHFMPVYAAEKLIEPTFTFRKRLLSLSERGKMCARCSPVAISLFFALISIFSVRIHFSCDDDKFFFDFFLSGANGQTKIETLPSCLDIG